MKVTLKVKKDNTVETIQHEIESINLLQFQKSLKIIKEVLDIVQKDESLKNLLVGAIESASNDDEEELDTRFLASAVEAFEVLLINIPEKAFELLAAMSGIGYDTLMSQKAEDVFDIYDAILEVNDIEKLFKRAKKSLAVTKAMTSFLKKSKKATKSAQA